VTKTKLGKFPLVYPVPIVLAGALVNGKPNYATLGDCGVMGLNPPLVYVSLHENHHTTKGILAHEAFSVNFPTTEMLVKTDYCGMVSGKNVEKSALFETWYGEMDTVPMIGECPVNLECRVIKEFAIQHRHIFIGEVVQSYLEESLVVEKNGRKAVPEMSKLDPILYGMDNRYYRIGPSIGTGYTEGRVMMQEKESSEIK
jgi:flavin reductase (DIM6/NTAB) family NADH-FMN oxidoreductase RutF